MPNGSRKKTGRGSKAHRGGSSKRQTRKRRGYRSKRAALRVIDEDLHLCRVDDADVDDAAAAHARRREQIRRERRSVARWIGRRYVEMLKCLSTEWGAALHHPFRIGGEWTEDDWNASVRPHRDGDVVTIRFDGAPDSAAVIDVHDLIHGPIGMTLLPGDTTYTRQATFRCDDPEFVCMHASFGSRTSCRSACRNSVVPALSCASAKLRSDPDFVARLLRLLRRYRRIESGARWCVWRELSCAHRSLRDDLPFALGLIHDHGIDAWSVGMGATRRVERYLKRHVPMRALALCVQRIRHRWCDALRPAVYEQAANEQAANEPAANEPAASRMWTVARDIAAFI